MKKVFNSNAEVIDKFVEQSQDEGRSGHIFFEKNTIYSYGHHYPMATIYKGIVLSNSKKSSMTTSRHTRRVEYATEEKFGDILIRVPYPNDIKNEDNLKYLKNQLHLFHSKMKKALLYKEWYYTKCMDYINDYRHLYRHLYNFKPKMYGNSEFVKQIKDEKNKFLEDRKKRTINNVIMPKPLFKKIQNKTLKPNDIFKERNAQRRSVLLGLYTYERLLKDTENKIIDTEGEYQLLLIKTPKHTRTITEWVGAEQQERKIETELPEDIMLLKVKCPSTGVYYVLRVPPTMQKCKEALSWTFEMSELEYKLEMET